MMKKDIKIIHIMSHGPPYHLYPNIDPPINWKSKHGEIVGLWDYEWGDIIFSKLIEFSGVDNFQFEVWQPDFKADKIYSYYFSNGLVHRLFPAEWKISKLTMFGGKKEIYSPLMLENLHQYNSEYVLLIHSFLNSRYNIRRIQAVFKNKVPILLQSATNTEYHPYYGVNAKKTIRRFISNIVLKKYYKSINYIFTSSNDTILRKRKTMLFKHEGLSNIGIDFNHLDCSVNKYDARKELEIGLNDFVFFASQRIVPEKQIDKLIVAISKLKGDNFKFFISGSGENDYIFKLKKIVEKFNLTSKIVFTSYLSEHDLKLYYTAADCFISTSLSEAGPDSIYKAMYYGLPIISTDTGIAYEFLRDNNSGVVIPRNDSTNWHNTIQKVLDSDLIIRKPNKNKVREFFSWRNIANYYLQTFNYILKDFNNGGNVKPNRKNPRTLHSRHPKS